jgi:tellurite resistance protein TerA
MTDLPISANTPRDGSTVAILLDLPGGAEIDVTALQIYAGGKVRGDDDMCFYGQPSIAGGAVRLTQGSSPRFDIELARVPGDVEKIVITATAEGGKTFGQLGDVSMDVGSHILSIPGQGRTEAALILAEIYRRNGAWKVRNVGQGFNGGLAQLATHFGVEIAAEGGSAPAPTPPKAKPKPAPAPSVNLSKVNLTKNESTVDLKKSDGRFGKIRVNLNWNQRAPQKKGLFGMGKSSGIDLDVGAFIELKDGYRSVVQALGEAFGSFRDEPYVKLLEDDRTGAMSDGEWLEINGDMWSRIDRILVYAFIYEGAPNWRETDGAVRILVPDQPEVEVRMNEYGSSDGMCAIAELSNAGDQIKINRLVEFFPGHRYMDEAYGWGFSWKTGRK